MVPFVYKIDLIAAKFIEFISYEWDCLSSANKIQLIQSWCGTVYGPESDHELTHEHIFLLVYRLY